MPGHWDARSRAERPFGLLAVIHSTVADAAVLVVAAAAAAAVVVVADYYSSIDLGRILDYGVVDSFQEAAVGNCYPGNGSDTAEPAANSAHRPIVVAAAAVAVPAAVEEAEVAVGMDGHPGTSRMNPAVESTRAAASVVDYGGTGWPVWNATAGDAVVGKAGPLKHVMASVF